MLPLSVVTTTFSCDAFLLLIPYETMLCHFLLHIDLFKDISCEVKSTQEAGPLFSAIKGQNWAGTFFFHEMFVALKFKYFMDVFF